MVDFKELLDFKKQINDEIERIGWSSAEAADYLHIAYATMVSWREGKSAPYRLVRMSTIAALREV